MESDAAPPMKMCLLVNLNRKISHKVYPIRHHQELPGTLIKIFFWQFTPYYIALRERCYSVSML